MILGAVLYVYKGEWGLPSIDFECLRALCAVKFTRAPIEINTSGNPLWSGAGTLPYLKIGRQKLVGYQKIKEFLDSEGFSLNANLSAGDAFLATAYNNFVFQRMHAYFYYHMFGHPINFDVTRSLYAKRTPFPFNFYYPGTYFRKTEEIVDVFANFKIYDKIEGHDTDELVLEAQRCINLLSKKLGNRVWFFGDSYSEYDAIVYSYISILFHIALPHNAVQSHIKECKNLVNFINRITKDIFREEGFNTKIKNNLAKRNSNSTLLTQSERDFMASKKTTQIVAGIVAFAAMSTYAAYNGLLRFSFDGNYSEHFGIEDDDDIGSDD